MTRWNNVFWVVFVVLGAAVIAGSMLQVVYIDLLFGLLVIGIGIAKLAEEISHRRMQLKHSMMNESIGYLTRQVDTASSAAMQLRDSSDSRFFQIGSRLSGMSERMEGRYEGAVKKLISLENRMNEHSRLMLELARRQEELKQKYAGMEERSIAALDQLSVVGVSIKDKLDSMEKAAKASKPQAQGRAITVPNAFAVPKEKILRFGLPKIAPRMTAGKGVARMPKTLKRRRPKRQ